METTVAEWTSYISDSSWPESWYVDDTEIEVNGKLVPDDVDFDVSGYAAFAPNDTVTILNGSIMNKTDRDFERALITDFRAWRKKQTTEFLAVEIPKDKADALKAIIKAHGGNVW